MHGHPGSQQRVVMQEKEALARVLLARGLTNAQVCGQLRCSRMFLRRVIQEMQEEAQLHRTS